MNEAAAAAAAEKPRTRMPCLAAQTVPAAAPFGTIEAASEASAHLDVRYNFLYELHELVNVQTHTFGGNECFDGLFMYKFTVFHIC
jgi:hypothetical protein